MKKVLAILMAFAMIFCVCGCNFAKDIKDKMDNDVPQPKTFEDTGISIELTTDFLRMDFVDEDYDFIIGNEIITIMGEKWSNNETGFEEFGLYEFAEYYRLLFESVNPTIVSDMEGIPTIKYTTTKKDGGDITAAVMFYESADSFWAVTFATDSDEFLKNYDDICKYAKSVKVE